MHVCIEKHESFSATLIFQSILHTQAFQHTSFLHVCLGIQILLPSLCSYKKQMCEISFATHLLTWLSLTWQFLTNSSHPGVLVEMLFCHH